MSVERLFWRRRPAGWLLLTPALPSFGGDYPDLAAHLLERIDLARTSTCVCAALADLPAAERFAEELGGLLGQETQVNLLGGTSALPTAPSLAALSGGSVAVWSEALGSGTPTTEWLSGFGPDGLILAADAAAAALGAWGALSQDADLTAGADWLPEAVLLPGTPDPGQLEPVRSRLSGAARAYAIGLPHGSALALGPEGEIELWGSTRPTILLGGGWRQG